MLHEVFLDKVCILQVDAARWVLSRSCRYRSSTRWRTCRGAGRHVHDWTARSGVRGFSVFCASLRKLSEEFHFLRCVARVRCSHLEIWRIISSSSSYLAVTTYVSGCCSRSTRCWILGEMTLAFSMSRSTRSTYAWLDSDT